mmetsp:Transcript_10242/g.25977  ORF Transcript_10242/g.25977 Transcript_10242/m.25977 type:complete len:455 (-) Transcript_10242:139-1503(-)
MPCGRARAAAGLLALLAGAMNERGTPLVSAAAVGELNEPALARLETADADALQLNAAHIRLAQLGSLKQRLTQDCALHIPAQPDHPSLDQLAASYLGFLERFRSVQQSVRGVDCARASAFRDNMVRAAALTARPQDDAEYSAEHSPYGDMAPEEFARTVLMQPLSVAAFPAASAQAAPAPKHIDAAAGDVDWTKHEGVVSLPQDQGSLGTCYAFAAAGNVEGQAAIKLGKGSGPLSVEHSLECDAMADPPHKNAVCGEFGGWPYLVFDFWKQAGGAVLASDWPYCAGTLDKHLMPLCMPCMVTHYNRESCGEHDDFYCNATSTLGQGPAGRCKDQQWLASKRVAQVTGWQRFDTDEELLAGQLAETGPLTATMDATTLQLYRRGVANPWFCSKTSFNHSVLLVGFGTDARSGKAFWKAKASWGTKWGESGFFRIVRGKEKCGINRAVTGATVAA